MLTSIGVPSGAIQLLENPTYRDEVRASDGDQVYLSHRGVNGEKLWIQGCQLPDSRSCNLTRFYLTIDPIRGQAVFFDLVAKLREKLVLGELDICLFLHSLDRLGPSRNAIVAYVHDVPGSNITDRFLSAYAKSKAQNSTLYELGRRKHALNWAQYRGFRLPLDANLSFAEMPPGDTSSFDNETALLLDRAIGLDPLHNVNPDIFLQHLRQHEKNGVVWDDESRRRMTDMLNSNGASPESVLLTATRRLRMPPLVQMQQYQYVDGQLFPMNVIAS